MAKNKYKKFLKKVKKFKQKQQKQKQRGLNDYNLLTTVLKPYDEVRLHSRMIGSLLNPDGLHYQDALFLEKFLEVLKLKDFNFDVKNAKLQLEYKNIDLYLCDGNKHIIIENKVYAGDQPSQIKRYIREILKENREISSSDICVIYLSIDREKPSDYSLGKEKDEDKEYFEVKNNELQYKGNDELLKDTKFKYKSIHYKTIILEWLKECQYEIQNITNLNEAIKQYINVIKILNNNYKGKVMKLSEELKKENNFSIAYDVYQEFQKTCASLENDFWNNLISRVKDIDGYKGIENKRDGKIQDSLDESIIETVRKSDGIKSEINLHFNLIEKKVKLIIGANNNKNGIYIFIFKPDWEKINNNIDEDNKIIEAINNISEYNFQHKSWHFGTTILDDTINLRNEKLIYANTENNIKKLSEKIENLIKQLKETI